MASIQLVESFMLVTSLISTVREPPVEHANHDQYSKSEAASPEGVMPGKLRLPALLHHVLLSICHDRKDAKVQPAVQLAIHIAAYHGTGPALTKVKPVLLAFTITPHHPTRLHYGVTQHVLVRTPSETRVHMCKMVQIGSQALQISGVS